MAQPEFLSLLLKQDILKGCEQLNSIKQPYFRMNLINLLLIMLLI